MTSKNNKAGRLLWATDFPDTHTGAFKVYPQDMGTDPAGFHRVLVLPADEASIEKMREAVAELCAIEIAQAFFRAQLNQPCVTDKREDYALADSIMAKLGLATPTKRRRE